MYFLCHNYPVNGRLAGRFEEYFGQFHYWDGYPFDFPYRYEGEELIWKQFRKDVLEKISQSVVSIASFHIHGDLYSCMLITRPW
jgi:hypothetical protein